MKISPNQVTYFRLYYYERDADDNRCDGQQFSEILSMTDKRVYSDEIKVSFKKNCSFLHHLVEISGNQTLFLSDESCRRPTHSSHTTKQQ